MRKFIAALPFILSFSAIALSGASLWLSFRPHTTHIIVRGQSSIVTGGFAGGGSSGTLGHGGSGNYAAPGIPGAGGGGGGSSMADAQVVRASRYIWPELEQGHIDAITAKLKPQKAPSEVVILCAIESRCGGVALNLENALESAKWPARIIIGGMAPDGRGLSTNNRAIADAIDQALGGAPRVKLDTTMRAVEPVFISIGDK